MTHLFQPASGAGPVPDDTVRAAMHAILSVRERPQRLLRVFGRTLVPMVLVDDQRRHVDANRSARLVLRLSKSELLRYRIDDLTPRAGLNEMRTAWRQLVEAGCVAGRHEVAGRDGSRLEVFFWAVSDVQPGRHLITFTPADWPVRELESPVTGDDGQSTPILTPREREVLQLAAEGLSGPGIAEALVISHATVRTHFEHIYEKLAVGDRSAAVATALRGGLIE